MAGHRNARIPPAGRLLAAFAAKVKDIAEKKVGDFADAEREQFTKDIEDQKFVSFHRFPLSWYTQQVKEELNLSPLVMVATREYLSSIKVYRNGFPGFPKSEKKLTIVIGIHPNKRARDMYTGQLRPDVAMETVAAANEYGYSRGPARPHWRPFLYAMRERAKEVRKEIKRLARDHWRQTVGT